jgi:hypothetical protein
VLRAEIFAVALAAVGYALQGWILAVAGLILFLVLLPIANMLVISRGPENAPAVVVFQAAKWTVAVLVLLLMLAARYLFWNLISSRSWR